MPHAPPSAAVAMTLIGVSNAAARIFCATFGVVKMPPWPTSESTATPSSLVITSMPILTGEKALNS